VDRREIATRDRLIFTSFTVKPTASTYLSEQKKMLSGLAVAMKWACDPRAKGPLADAGNTGMTEEELDTVGSPRSQRWYY
jgi:hypothetical protein